MTEKISSTWLLFASGKYAEIDTYIYPAASESTRPIDAYIVSECQGDFTKSARRAADVIYHIFRQKHDIKPIVVGYDILTNGEQTLTGRSGGLSFAAAITKALLQSSGYPDPGDIAATGEILSKGEIGGINAINAKFEAAHQFLKDGSWFFYPIANHKEANEASIDQLKAKGVNVHGISNLYELIDLLEIGDLKKTESKPRYTFFQKAMLILSSTIIVLVILLLTRQYFTEKFSVESGTLHETKQAIHETRNSETILFPRKLKAKIIHEKPTFHKPEKTSKKTHKFKFAPPLK